MEFKLFIFLCFVTLRGKCFVESSDSDSQRLCSSVDGYTNQIQDGQAFYAEHGKLSGRWRYPTADGWVRWDNYPKDKLTDAPDNWPQWIWHDCGRKNGYPLACMESGKYPDYYAWNNEGWRELSYSASPKGYKDLPWAGFYVIEKKSNGYTFLCNIDDTRVAGDPENCKKDVCSNRRYCGIWFYMYVPPTCAGWKRTTCNHGASQASEYTYTQGLTKTESRETTVTMQGSQSATFGLGLSDVLNIGGSKELRATFSMTDVSSKSQFEEQSTKLYVDPGKCLWSKYVTYADFQLNTAQHKQCSGDKFCF